MRNERENGVAGIAVNVSAASLRMEMQESWMMENCFFDIRGLTIDTNNLHRKQRY